MDKEFRNMFVIPLTVGFVFIGAAGFFSQMAVNERNSLINHCILEKDVSKDYCEALVDLGKYEVKPFDNATYSQ